MNEGTNWLKRTVTIIGLLVGITALVTFTVNYTTIKGELQTVGRELAAEKERNRRAFELLQWSTSQGNIPYPKLIQHLSEDDAAQIVRRAGLQVTEPFPFHLDDQFFPSGWMGDGEYGEKYLSFSRRNLDVNGSTQVVVAVHYRAGPKGWAGIYWQYPDGNWGEEPGKSLVGAHAITFRARGERGGEIVEFKSGGVRGRKHSDSFEKSLGAIALSDSWQEYTIDLSGADLSSVVGGFAWSAAASENRGELRFYLSDLLVR